MLSSLERGAAVTGLEISAPMAELARRRLAQRASIEVAEGPVTFWRRPLTAMIASFRATGSLMDDIVEQLRTEREAGIVRGVMPGRARVIEAHRTDVPSVDVVPEFEL